MTSHSSLSCLELIRACAESNDGSAWTEFVCRFHRPISLTVIRAAYQWGNVSRQMVDDFVQETYLKLCTDRCQTLLDFAAAHADAVVGYVKTIAFNVVRDHFKAQHAQKRGSGEIAESLEEGQVVAGRNQSGGPAAMDQQILLQQIDHCLEACCQGPDEERDRMIFWLYYQQGMSATSIAGLPTIDLSAKGVESVIFRLTRMVREQLVRWQSETAEERKHRGKGFSPAKSF